LGDTAESVLGDLLAAGDGDAAGAGAAGGVDTAVADAIGGVRDGGGTDSVGPFAGGGPIPG